MRNVVLAIIAIVFVCGCNSNSENRDVKPLAIVTSASDVGHVVGGPVPITSELGIIRVKTTRESLPYRAAIVSLSASYKIGDQVLVTPVSVRGLNLSTWEDADIVERNPFSASQPAAASIEAMDRPIKFKYVLAMRDRSPASQPAAKIDDAKKAPPLDQPIKFKYTIAR